MLLNGKASRCVAFVAVPGQQLYIYIYVYSTKAAESTWLYKMAATTHKLPSLSLC
jgi:hypothetical protein